MSGVRRVVAVKKPYVRCMVSKADSINRQIAHGRSLRSIKMVRKSCLVTKRK